MNESPFRKRMTLELLRDGAGKAADALKDLNASDAAAGFDVSDEPLPEPYELLLLGVGKLLKLIDAPEDERDVEQGDDAGLIRLIDAVRRTPGGVSDIAGLLRILEPTALASSKDAGWFSLDFEHFNFRANDGQLWFLDSSRMQSRTGDE